jgi:hypothetical protein
VLTFFRWKVRTGDQAWHEDWERANKIAQAIETLVAILPKQQETYAAFADALAGLDPATAAKVKADIAAIDELFNAARSARDRGLPVAPLETYIKTSIEHAVRANQIPTIMPLMMLMRRPWTSWHQFAEHLKVLFHDSFPGRPKDSAYRFIAAVLPHITGDDLNWRTVKAELLQNRNVKREERQS